MSPGSRPVFANLGRKTEAEAELWLARHLPEKKEQERQLVPQPYRPN